MCKKKKTEKGRIEYCKERKAYKRLQKENEQLSIRSWGCYQQSRGLFGRNNEMQEEAIYSKGGRVGKLFQKSTEWGMGKKWHSKGHLWT